MGFIVHNFIYSQIRGHFPDFFMGPPFFHLDLAKIYGVNVDKYTGPMEAYGKCYKVGQKTVINGDNGAIASRVISPKLPIYFLPFIMVITYNA